MRNYVFVRNSDSRQVLEEHLEDDSSLLTNVGVEHNRKGMVLKFNDAHFSERIQLFVENELNDVAHALVVEPYETEERKRANAYLRSLKRINTELIQVTTILKKQERRSKR